MKILYSILSVIACSTIATNAITIANFSQPTNDRFSTDPSFIGAGYDWSGVGRRADGGRWATLISDSSLGAGDFITANHFNPGVGATVEFYKDNGDSDPNNDIFSYVVASGSRIGNTDLWIGTFTTAVDPTLARYSFSTSTPTYDPAIPEADQTLFLSGNANSATGSPFNHGIGTNIVEFTQPSTNVATLGNFDVVGLAVNLPGDSFSPLTTHEAELRGGDSGSPLFSKGANNTLVLEGIASAVGNINDHRVNLYNSIPDITTSFNIIASPVPEPSSLIYCLLSLPALAFRSRRSQKNHAG